MRKREREKVIGKLDDPLDGEHGHPLCVRPYRSDEKMLDEITKETGESRSALVRRMIRFALSDRHERFGANRCRDRLDLLIDQGRRRRGRGSRHLAPDGLWAMGSGEIGSGGRPRPATTRSLAGSFPVGALCHAGKAMRQVCATTLEQLE